MDRGNLHVSLSVMNLRYFVGKCSLSNIVTVRSEVVKDTGRGCQLSLFVNVRCLTVIVTWDVSFRCDLLFPVIQYLQMSEFVIVKLL